MLKKMRRWFSSSTGRVKVKTQISWQWQLLSITVIGLIGFLLVFEIYDAGRRYAGFDRRETEQELANLRESEAKLRQENSLLRAAADASDSKLQIEYSAQQQLAKQVKVLESENARLKEDLVFFENLIPTEGKQNTLSINRFKVEPDIVPGQFRYRLLLLQTGKREREFNGALQFLVSLQQNGKSVTIIFPRSGEKEQVYKISFKRLHRVEGIFSVDPGSLVKTVQVRLLENGIPKVTQTFNVS